MTDDESGDDQWHTHWTRLDKCQGPPGSRGPKSEIIRSDVNLCM